MTLYHWNHYICFVLVLHLICINDLTSATWLKSRRALLTRLYSCPDMSDLPNNYENITIESDGKTAFLTGAVRVTEMMDDISLKITVETCEDPMDKITCRNYLHFNVAKFCDKLKEKNQFWSDFNDNLEPPYECPIKPGKYRINHAPITSTEVRFFPMLKANIKVTSKLIQKGKLMMCYIHEGEIINN